MLKRRAKSKMARNLTGGPGALSQALGIDRSFNGLPLLGPKIWLEEGSDVKDDEVVTSPRVGVDYAGDDAQLPWRYRIKDSPWTSPAK